MEQDECQGADENSRRKYGKKAHQILIF